MSDELNRDVPRAGSGTAEDELSGDQPDFEGHRNTPPNRAGNTGGISEDEGAGDEPDFEGHRDIPTAAERNIGLRDSGT